jgi:hypothetical protein
MQLGQSLLKIIPGHIRHVSRRAFRLRLIGAQKNVSFNAADTELTGDFV